MQKVGVQKFFSLAPFAKLYPFKTVAPLLHMVSVELEPKTMVWGHSPQRGREQIPWSAGQESGAKSAKPRQSPHEAELFCS